jgi:hypothetical protein
MTTTQRTYVFSTIPTIKRAYFLIQHSTVSLCNGEDSVYYGAEAQYLSGIQALDIQKPTAASLLATHKNTSFIVHQADQDTGTSFEIKDYLPNFFLVLPIFLPCVGLRIKN